jgi:hypothetical protein
MPPELTPRCTSQELNPIEKAFRDVQHRIELRWDEADAGNCWGVLNDAFASINAVDAGGYIRHMHEQMARM